MLPRLLTGGNKHNVLPNVQRNLLCIVGVEGRMVACDQDSCLIEWFHFECVGLTQKPRGKWLCHDDCETQLKKQSHLLIKQY